MYSLFDWRCDCEFVPVASTVVSELVTEWAFSSQRCVIVLNQVVGLLEVGGVVGDLSSFELRVVGLKVDEEDAIIVIDIFDLRPEIGCPSKGVIVEPWSLVELISPWVPNANELLAVDFDAAKDCVDMVLDDSSS